MITQLNNRIQQFFSESPLNCREDGGLYFDAPLLGFAAADDPLFQEFKAAIGPFYTSPRELLETEFGASDWQGGTVISWVLPINEEVRSSNRPEKEFPSRLWAHTRNFGDLFNRQLGKEIARFLLDAGYRALAPQLSAGWKKLDEPGKGPTSNWSERHAAYAAGLGTFSLNDGLITERGIAHRCGSVVTDLILPPTERHYRSHTENCTFYREGKCGACIARCPVGALSVAGHDKIKCQGYTYGTVFERVGDAFGVQITGCGLCQTKVPCESKIP